MNAIPLKLALAGVWIVTVAGAFFAGNRLADSSRSDPAAASLTPGAVTFPSSPGGGSSAAATASGASPAGGTGDAPASATGAEKRPATSAN